MLGSVTSVFGEAEDFEDALRIEGCFNLLVTGPGAFRARLTQIALHCLRLTAAEEHLPRIAFVAVPPEMLLVSLPTRSGPAPIWGGVRLGANEIMTLAADQRLHMRTDGPCRWGSIWLPVGELVRYGSALTGAAFAVPSVARWRVRPAMIRHLRHLHSAGIGAAERSPNVLLGGDAAHGLEQQLIHALVECLSDGSVIEATCPTREHQDVAIRLEALLQAQPARALSMADICTMLGVSARTLCLSCREQLGMAPAEYLRRRWLQRVYRA